mmetsp:Transcript_61831/g.177967  ORF Transcript_61831/g.177967 Transcript_61831/m.177967 type:complete len:222 (-) Transcript_61831:470-1135(-)
MYRRGGLGVRVEASCVRNSAAGDWPEPREQQHGQELGRSAETPHSRDRDRAVQEGLVRRKGGHSLWWPRLAHVCARGPLAALLGRDGACDVASHLLRRAVCLERGVLHKEGRRPYLGGFREFDASDHGGRGSAHAIGRCLGHSGRAGPSDLRGHEALRKEHGFGLVGLPTEPARKGVKIGVQAGAPPESHDLDHFDAHRGDGVAVAVLARRPMLRRLLGHR